MQFLLRYLLVHDVDAVIAAGVAVVMREPDEGTVAQQPVVDGPGVDPDADQVRGLAAGLGEAAADVVKQPGQVPVHRGALAIPQIDRFVGEPGQRPDVQGARTDRGEHDPAAGRPEVDRGEVAGAARHRRNAAATPASTGTCRPVVWEKSDVHNANAALAMFSGSTSRLSRVRWA